MSLICEMCHWTTEQLVDALHGSAFRSIDLPEALAAVAAWEQRAK
jgi:hypothetical protein